MRKRANATATIVTNSDQQQQHVFTMHKASSRRRMQDNQFTEQDYSETQPMHDSNDELNSKEKKQLSFVILNRIRLSRICRYIVPFALLLLIISFHLFHQGDQNQNPVSLSLFL
jgi:hypothetical protein